MEKSAVHGVMHALQYTNNVKLTRRGGVRNAWPESAFWNKLGSPVTVAGTMGIGAGHSYRTTSKRLADSGRLFKSGSNDAVQPNVRIGCKLPAVALDGISAGCPVKRLFPARPNL